MNIHGLLIHSKPNPLALDTAKALVKHWTKPDAHSIFLVYGERDGALVLWNRNAHWVASLEGPLAAAAAKGLAFHLDAVNNKEDFGAIIAAESLHYTVIVVSPDPDVLKPYTFSPVLELKYPEHP